MGCMVTWATAVPPTSAEMASAVTAMPGSFMSFPYEVSGPDYQLLLTLILRN